MGRGSSISIRDRLIVWNSICKGINSPTQIKKIFDDTGEREISVDSIRRLIKEFEDFKRLLPEYPDLTEELKDLVAGEGIILCQFLLRGGEVAFALQDLLTFYNKGVYISYIEGETSSKLKKPGRR